MSGSSPQLQEMRVTCARLATPRAPGWPRTPALRATPSRRRARQRGESTAFPGDGSGALLQETRSDARRAPNRAERLRPAAPAAKPSSMVPKWFRIARIVRQSHPPSWLKAETQGRDWSVSDSNAAVLLVARRTSPENTAVLLRLVALPPALVRCTRQLRNGS